MWRSSLILKGFHPDPSVIRVDDTFYVANSTFEWFPGVEVHESKDLLHWKLTGHLLTSADMLPMEGVLNGGGVWAPCLSYDGDTYYLVFSIVRTFDEFTQDNNNYLTWAKDIHGPWSRPVYINSGGFDASLFHDSDGRKYLINMVWDETINRNHFHGIEMQELDAGKKRLTGPRRIIYKGTKRGLTEGPHIYKKDGWYYLLTAEGGTAQEHCITIARSRDVWGPYETFEPHPVLTSHGHPELAVQYAGHGDLIDDKLGNWYLFHLGSRKNLFGGYSVFGRETFLQNIVWPENGWPVLREGIFPREEVEIPDEFVEGSGAEDSFFKEYRFDTGTISPDFMSLRRPLGREDMSLEERPGYLRLYGRESLSSRFRQTLLAVRIQEESFCAETIVDFNPIDIRQRAGLIFYYHSANYYYLYIGYDDEKQKRFLQLVKRDCKHTQLMLDKPVELSDEGEILLGGMFSTGGLRFYWGESRKEVKPLEIPVEACPVTILSDEYANVCYEQGFTGSFVGICAQDLSGTGHPADFAVFSLKPIYMGE